MQSHSLHVAVSECPAWLTQGRAALPPRQSSPRSPSECRAPGICLHTALTSSQHRQRLLPLLRAREKGAIPASAVTRMTRAHIGNSTVPGSRCDLPVAHLLASVKCKSLRASVSAQYSQEHEGSCAKGRVRAGRQQRALFPPLSGIYGLKKSAYSRGFAGAVSVLNPVSAPSWGLAWGTTPVGSNLSAETLAPTLWLQRAWHGGAGGSGCSGCRREVPCGSEGSEPFPLPGPAGRWFPPCPFPDGSSPNPVGSLEMATETLVAMVILNSSDSDVALLGNRIRSPWEAMPALFFFFFSLVVEKGSESPFCSPLAAVQ